MSAIAPCPSCQWGDHDGHIASWKPPPPGAMGGFYCRCEGDCSDDMSPLIEHLMKAFTEPIDPDEPNRSCFIYPKDTE